MPHHKLKKLILGSVLLALVVGIVLAFALGAREYDVVVDMEEITLEIALRHMPDVEITAQELALFGKLSSLSCILEAREALKAEDAPPFIALDTQALPPLLSGVPPEDAEDACWEVDANVVRLRYGQQGWQYDTTLEFYDQKGFIRKTVARRKGPEDREPEIYENTDNVTFRRAVYQREYH